MNKLHKNPAYSSALKIVETLQHKKFKAFFVGGAVRDILLGKMPHDIDIATSALPGQVSEIFAKSYEVGAAFGIINVIENNISFEVATFRKEREYLDGRHPEKIEYTDDPELDAIRRDFTINAVFFDPVKESFLDFTGGREDLGKGILRTVGNPLERFSEDYLRILRAVRFCVRFGMKLADEIAPAVAKTVKHISKLSPERIRDELNKMLAGPDPDKAVRMMFDLGILREILPEIAEMHGVEQHEEYHPEGDVFQHTLLMLSHMAAYPDLELAWSILLHDVGKPVTKSIGDDGIEHFYTHEQKSAEFAEKILKRFRFPNKNIENIVQAVRNHMRFAHICEMRTAKWKRMLAEANFPLEMELHRIDCISSHKKMDVFTLLLDRILEQQNTVELPKSFLNGKDLIKLGMVPGPAFKEILRKAVDLQLEGKLNSREEALEWLKSV